MLDQLNGAALNVLAAAAPAATPGGSVPDPGSGTPPPGFDKFLTLLKWAASISIGLCVLGFIACAGTIAIQHRTGSGLSDHGSRVGAVMAACLLVGSASAIVTALT